jgi:hypothetical protein
MAAMALKCFTSTAADYADWADKTIRVIAEGCIGKINGGDQKMNHVQKAPDKPKKKRQRTRFCR